MALDELHWVGPSVETWPADDVAGTLMQALAVKVFRRQLYARCGLSSQAELLALMLALSLIHISEPTRPY